MLFNIMKSEVSQTIEKYGPDSPPPPSQVYTIKNAPGEGNLHFVQKVFKGPFEVWCLEMLQMDVWLDLHTTPVRYPFLV